MLADLMEYSKDDSRAVSMELKTVESTGKMKVALTVSLTESWMAARMARLRVVSKESAKAFLKVERKVALTVDPKEYAKVGWKAVKMAVVKAACLVT